jgi:hypothetical protein
MRKRPGQSESIIDHNSGRAIFSFTWNFIYLKATESCYRTFEVDWSSGYLTKPYQLQGVEDRKMTMNGKEGLGCAITQLVDGLPPRRPGFDSMWDHMRFVMEKAALGKFSSTSASPTNYHSTDCCIYSSIVRSWYSTPRGDPRTERIKPHPTPTN